MYHKRETKDQTLWRFGKCVGIMIQLSKGARVGVLTGAFGASTMLEVFVLQVLSVQADVLIIMMHHNSIDNWLKLTKVLPDSLPFQIPLHISSE